MTLKELLGSDMATLERAARAGAAWWVDELAQMVPARLRRTGGRGGPVASFLPGHGLQGTPPAGFTLTIPRSLCLTRTITVPPMRGAELDQMLALEGERYLPLPQGSALLSSAILGLDEAGEQMSAEVAALPMGTAREVADAIVAAGAEPSSIRIDGSGIDFLPAFRAARLLPSPPRAARAWWIAVGLLFALNAGLLIWRDVARVAQLEQLVAAQQPAVNVAQRITQQMRRSDAVVRRAALRREQWNALSVLGLATAAVPAGAWVQRLDWDGDTLRLAGYRRADVNVMTALRASPAIASVKNAQSDALAEIAAGQPFDVVAMLKAP